MSELAAEIVNGACCAQCYAPFEQDNQFPAICWACWEEVTPDAEGFVGDAQKSVFPVRQ